MIRTLILSFFLFFFDPGPLQESLAADFSHYGERVCETSVIIKYKFKGLTREEVEAVAIWALEIGKIELKHFQEVMEIIAEVYSARDNKELAQIMENRCIGRTI